MTQIVCHTNLDLCPCENWPTELPSVPCVGDLIESGHVWSYESGRSAILQLKVVRITWRAKIITNTVYPYTHTTWTPYVELHLERGQFENINQFYEWYGKITGRGKHAFI